MKKIFCSLALFILTILPAAAMAESVSYTDASGQTQTADCIMIESADDYAFESGKWYAVRGEVTITNRIENKAPIEVPARLILTDGCTFSVPKGIHNPQGTGLTVYGQTNGTGECRIDAVGADNAGIGGNRCENAGDLSINGGTVTVIAGSNGACIGGGGAREGAGYYARAGNGGHVTINGGTVTVSGVSAYASVGIGGGSCTNGGDSGDITINGGTVTAISSKGTYAIGSGVANGGSNGSWNGSDGNCGIVTINGGHVTVKGYLGGTNGVITVNNCEFLEADPSGHPGCVSIINAKEVSITNSNVIAPWIHAGSKITIKKSTVTGSGSLSEPGSIDDTDGTFFKDQGGINTDKGGEILIEDSTVTTAGSGFRAGIGGPSEPGAATNITIIRSKVTASACWGAGIGSDQYDGIDLSEKAGNITITDSIVTASSQAGAGIGGGRHCNGGNVMISGSTVIAYSSGVPGVSVGIGIGAGFERDGHGSLSIDETAYEILSGSSSSREYKSLKAYMSAPDPYVMIHPIPAYTVTYAGRTTDGTGYETLNTADQTGHTGAPVTPKILKFDGFTFSHMDEGKTIAADGSTTVSVYYDRLGGTLVFDANGHGTAPSPITAPAGSAVKQPAKPKATGYVFDGWYEERSCETPYKFTTMPAGVKTVYAKWSVAYKIIKGANQSIQSTASSAVFASNAGFDKFVRLEVDGKNVAAKYYTAASGSTVITLNKKYIATLVTGSHTLKIVSSDGSASTKFTVAVYAPGPVPSTGDTARPMIPLTLMLLSAAALCLAIPGYTRRKNG